MKGPQPLPQKKKKKKKKKKVGKMGTEVLLEDLWFTVYSGLLPPSLEELVQLSEADFPSVVKPFRRRKLLVGAKALLAMSQGAVRSTPAIAKPKAQAAFLAPEKTENTTDACTSCSGPNLPGFRFCQMCGAASSQATCSTPAVAPVVASAPPVETVASFASGIDEDEELLMLRAQRMAIEAELGHYVDQIESPPTEKPSASFAAVAKAKSAVAKSAPPQKK